jgi:hypothetical protein
VRSIRWNEGLGEKEKMMKITVAGFVWTLFVFVCVLGFLQAIHF